MMDFIFGAIITWFLLGLGYSIWWGENNWYTLLMEIPGGILEILLEILLYPFILFYCIFLRHTLHPVNPAVLEVQRIILDSHKVYRNIYFCYDKKARAFRNKFFFFRVNPEIPDPTKPSCPKGKFRIGD